jgi:hypothetical protein
VQVRDTEYGVERLHGFKLGNGGHERYTNRRGFRRFQEGQGAREGYRIMGSRGYRVSIWKGGT